MAINVNPNLNNGEKPVGGSGSVAAAVNSQLPIKDNGLSRTDEGSLSRNNPLNTYNPLTK